MRLPVLVDVESSNRYVVNRTDTLFAGGAAIVTGCQGAPQLERNTMALRDASNGIPALAPVSSTCDPVNVFISQHSYALPASNRCQTPIGRSARPDRRSH
jgi:hypothetical protein